MKKKKKIPNLPPQFSSHHPLFLTPGKTQRWTRPTPRSQRETSNQRFSQQSYNVKLTTIQTHLSNSAIFLGKTWSWSRPSPRTQQASNPLRLWSWSSVAPGSECTQRPLTMAPCSLDFGGRTLRAHCWDGFNGMVFGELDDGIIVTVYGRFGDGLWWLLWREIIKQSI